MSIALSQWNTPRAINLFDYIDIVILGTEKFNQRPQFTSVYKARVRTSSED